MSKTVDVEIEKLSLDLNNPRTIPQKNEREAIQAMVEVNKDKFEAIIKSLIDEGYLNTENIIVLKDKDKLTVKEGNRRIAAMKILHGVLKASSFDLSDSLKKKIASLPEEWFVENKKVSCAVFTPKEIERVNKIVSLTHATGVSASRDQWTSVARARYNRDVRGTNDPTLELLEKYIQNGRNLSDFQKDRWKAEYGYSVLEIAMSKLHSKFEVTSPSALAIAYPKVKFRDSLERILFDIGLEQLKIREIRDETEKVAARYDLPLKSASTPPSSGGVSGGSSVTSGNTGPTQTPPQTIGGSGSQPNGSAPESPTGGASGPDAPAKTNKSTGAKTPKSENPDTQAHVRALLKTLVPRGIERSKVASLQKEMKELQIDKNPIAFALLLRSIFELSAKIYCGEKSIPLTKEKTKKDGKKERIERTLSELLSDVVKGLTDNGKDKEASKVLHAAKTEISNPSKVLSITSMNQIVHNTTFVVVPREICHTFSMLFPLLKAMNP